MASNDSADVVMKEAASGSASAPKVKVVHMKVKKSKDGGSKQSTKWYKEAAKKKISTKALPKTSKKKGDTNDPSENKAAEPEKKSALKKQTTNDKAKPVKSVQFTTSKGFNRKQQSGTTDEEKSSGSRKHSVPSKLLLQKPVHAESVSKHHGEPMTPMTPMVKSSIALQDTDVFRGIELKQVSGGLLTAGSVVFSGDSSLFYVVKDSAVAVYNVENCELVQTLLSQKTKDGYTPAQVTAIVAGEGRQLYTFLQDKSVRLLDADTGEVLSEWYLGGRVKYVVADPLEGGSFYCILNKCEHSALVGAYKKSEQNLICHVQLKSGKEPVMTVLELILKPQGLQVRPDGRWVVAYSEFKLCLLHIKGYDSVITHYWNMQESVSTVALHPTEPIMAVGDWRGRILFWFCLDESAPPSYKPRGMCRPMHWHAHRVNAVAFGVDGRLMLSGGEEGVFVMWHLGTEKRDFLPRLGAEIQNITISPNQMLYAVSLRDNTVRIISAMNNTVVAALQGLKFAQRGALAAYDTRVPLERRHKARLLEDDALTTGLVVHPTTHSLVLNGEPGFLQMFNHMTDRHISGIQVAPYNYLNPIRGQGDMSQQPQQPHVDIVQFSSDGSWMVTADSRNDNNNTLQSHLKFWRLNTENREYYLVTRIDSPHVGGVRALAFEPGRGSMGNMNGLICVSTGRDGAFRVWELDSSNTDEYIWSCRSTVRFRGMQPRGCAFSADGSTLAVAFGGTLTLWDAATCAAPVCVLVASAATPDLTGVAFIGASPYLAAWSGARLDVWNMLTGSVWWTLAAPLQCVYAHPRSSLLAVAAYQVVGRSTATVMVLDPASPVPLTTLYHSGGVEAIALVPSTTSSANASTSAASAVDAEGALMLPDLLQNNTLVVLTPNGLLNVYGAVSDTKASSGVEPGMMKVGQATTQASMSAQKFNSIFGGGIETTKASLQQQDMMDDDEEAIDAMVPPSADKHVREAMRLIRSAVQNSYVNAPHHVLPPVTSMYDQFVAAQLIPLKTKDEDNNGDMDVENDDQVIPGSSDTKGDIDMVASDTKVPDTADYKDSGMVDLGIALTKALCKSFVSGGRSNVVE
ncbi:NET1-associated nuclear protein 1 [Coemansia sp. Benny D115]|nr:NET1-associated nuclear protein 1 [Coemansia sp. Benny D115]